MTVQYILQTLKCSQLGLPWSEIEQKKAYSHRKVLGCRLEQVRSRSEVTAVQAKSHSNKECRRQRHWTETRPVKHNHDKAVQQKTTTSAWQIRFGKLLNYSFHSYAQIMPVIMYLILTEYDYEVNIGNKSRVKDRGGAEVFYEVFISYTDQVRSQY